jgi:hypothetical protein
VDNASKKRWVGRFNDPKAPAQLDAGFVAVEASGGSHKPTSNLLLFAYLHIDPNHPCVLGKPTTPYSIPHS